MRGVRPTFRLLTPVSCLLKTEHGRAFTSKERTRCMENMCAVVFYGQAERAISNGKLNVLLRLHIRPIQLVVFQCPSNFRWEISSWGRFRAYMHSALILTELRYPAMPLA